jgi:hypothetical protein
MHEFLRRSRNIAATAVAALFGHHTTMSPRLAGRGFIANIDIAIAHDETPFLGGGSRRATARIGLAAFAMRRPVGGFGSRRRRFVEQRKVKKPHRLSNRLVFVDVLSSGCGVSRPLNHRLVQ